MTSKETLDAIRVDSWEVLELPIPVDADQELLQEMFGACAGCIQISRDIIAGDGEITPPTPDKLAWAHGAYERSTKRIIQIEWRLNLMGLYQEDWGPLDSFVPADRNERVKRIIANMAKSDHFDIG